MWAICKSIQGHHDQNEDAYFVSIKQKEKELLGMAVICDGVGGWDDGEIASAFVVNAIKHFFETRCEILDKQAVIQEVEKIHQALQDYGKQKTVRLGTTMSLLFFNQSNYITLQVGDSRIYRINERCTQITKDQTLACYKRDHQLLDEDAFKRSHEHHILMQCVGMDKALAIETQMGNIQNPTYFFLCSDGQYKLHETIMEDLVEFYGKDEGNARLYSTYLCQRVQGSGEVDDITHIVLQVP